MLHRHTSRYSHTVGRQIVTDRFQMLFFVAVFLFTIIVGKLVWLQLIHGSEYRALAEEQNSRGIVLPAKRGSIFTRDYRTDELFPLAQNSTSYTIFADPFLIESGTETQLAEMLLPFLWTEDDTSAVAAAASKDPVAELALSPRQTFESQLVKKLVTKNAIRRELHDVTAEELKLVNDAFLPGVVVDGEILAIDPTLIDDPEDTATKLAIILNADYDDIYPLMQRKKVRYAKLAGRVSPGVRDEIIALNLRGIGSIPEYRRVYPEHTLAAQVIGFLDNDENGAYGVEGAHNKKLSGQAGLRRTQVDPFSRQITVGDVTIRDATDGTSLVLTIDRVVQEVTERYLAEVVDFQRADSGQAIVMDPHTGAILALAHYPTFDPNDFGSIYEREELIKKERTKKYVDAAGNVVEEKEEWWETAAGEQPVVEWGVEYVVRGGYRFPVFTERREDEEIKSIYANRLGEAVFALKAATEPYEPGSVFKPLVMAAALDAGEVTPTTRGDYDGPVALDEYIGTRQIVIKNAQGKYFGRETMTEVLQHSSNIGMTFVAQKLGRATFHDYLKKFGFGERTDVELEGEDAGTLENYTKWSESELVTKAYGQGISVNIFQLAAGFSVLANGGLLMKPYIVDEEIASDGKITKTEPETVRRVIDAQTSATITQMLVASVENGFAKPGGVDGYFIAGKTGTSQTYFRGKALNDLGTTIAAFGGYAPATDPKFVLIVKIDRPRVSEWGAAVAAPVFQKIAEELLKNYFAVPPRSN